MHKQKPQSEKVLALLRIAPPTTGETIGNGVAYNLLKGIYGDDAITLIRFNRKRLETRASGTIDFIDIAHTLLFTLPITLSHLAFKRYTHLYFVPASNKLGLIIDIIFMSMSRLRGIKPIAHARSGAFSNMFTNTKYSLIEKCFLRLVHKIIFLSHSLSLPVQRTYPSKCEIIFNTIDEAVMPKHSLKTKPNKIRVLFASNFYEAKGYNDILDAIEILPTDYSGRLQFTFCGQWPKSELEKQPIFIDKINQLKKQIDIEYLGAISSREELRKIYSKSDILCLPTYYPVEAQPRSIIEAISHGLGIITTEHASIPEMLTNSNFVKWVSKKSPQQIAQAIQSLLEQGSIQHIKKNSTAYFHEHFSTKASEKKLRIAFK